MRIFILEDDDHRIKLLQEILHRHSLTVIGSCLDAGQFDPPYDLVLLDHDLGGRQLLEHEDCGLTFVRMVKDRISKHTPVIVHSYNNSGAEAMLQELDSPMAVYAPFMGSQFVTILEMILAQYRKENQ